MIVLEAVLHVKSSTSMEVGELAVGMLLNPGVGEAQMQAADRVEETTDGLATIICRGKGGDF